MPAFYLANAIIHGSDAQCRARALISVSLGVLRRVSDDAHARFAALGLSVERDELSSALTWFALLPILAELLIGARAATSLGLDPASQHMIFERQLSEVYGGFLSRLRSHTRAEDRDA